MSLFTIPHTFLKYLICCLFHRVRLKYLLSRPTISHRRFHEVVPSLFTRASIPQKPTRMPSPIPLDPLMPYPSPRSFSFPSYIPAVLRLHYQLISLVFPSADGDPAPVVGVIPENLWPLVTSCAFLTRKWRWFEQQLLWRQNKSISHKYSMICTEKTLSIWESIAFQQQLKKADRTDALRLRHIHRSLSSFKVAQ